MSAEQARQREMIIAGLSGTFGERKEALLDVDSEIKGVLLRYHGNSDIGLPILEMWAADNCTSPVACCLWVSYEFPNETCVEAIADWIVANGWMA